MRQRRENFLKARKEVPRRRTKRKTRNMKLKILLPYQVLLEEGELEKIVVETIRGAMGIRPELLDCVAILNPGILSYQPAGRGAVYVAVNSGVLVKSGPDVAVSVSRAVIGPDLPQLRAEVENHVLNLDEDERKMRTALGKMERRLSAVSGR
jgi:F-type H+-transporting ATPase subunit epsilon